MGAFGNEERLLAQAEAAPDYIDLNSLYGDELPPMPQNYAASTNPERSLLRSIIARVKFHRRHHRHYHVIHRVVEAVGL